MALVDISIAEVALILGGGLSTAGSICAILALLDRPGKETLNSIAVCFLGLGAVLLLWPVVSERSTGIRIYWAVLILLMLGAAILFLLSRRSSRSKNEIPEVALVKEADRNQDSSDAGSSPEDPPR